MRPRRRGVAAAEKQIGKVDVALGDIRVAGHGLFVDGAGRRAKAGRNKQRAEIIEGAEVIGRVTENRQIGLAGIARPAKRIEEGGTLDPSLDVFRRGGPLSRRRAAIEFGQSCFLGKPGWPDARRRSYARAGHGASGMAEICPIAIYCAAATRNADTCNAVGNASMSASVVR